MPCPAGLKMMRQAQSGQRAVSVGVTSTLLVQSDPGRVALIISPPAGGDLWLSLRSAAVSTVGMRLHTNSNPLLLTIGEHGTLVQGPIFGVCPGGAENIAVWESSLPLNGG